MSINHRAAALQGLGFGVVQMAYQGYAPASFYARAPQGGGYSVKRPPGIRWATPGSARYASQSTRRP